MFYPPAIQYDKSASDVSPLARKQFEHALMVGRVKKVAALVSRKSRRLQKLDDVRNSGRLVNQYYLGRVTVPVAKIRGSVDRVDSFDIDFYPVYERSSERWGRVATAILEGKAMPPVELIQVGDEYYVVDGHHRISVARSQRTDFIDAVVTVWEVTPAFSLR